MKTKQKELKTKYGSGKRGRGAELIPGKPGRGFLLMD
jgi:hypothetical protein